MGASVGLGVWLARRHWRWGVCAVALNLLLSIAVMHARDLPVLRSHLPADGRDLHARVSGWRQLATALQPLFDARGRPVLLSSERTLLAQMGYYLNPRPYPVRAYDADGVIDHHYELIGRDLPLPPSAVWVGSEAVPDALALKYRHVEALPAVRMRTPQGLEREVQMAWLRQ